jgi:hemerythrin superfamily protein
MVVTPKAKRPGIKSVGGDTMDAIELLTDDHRKVKKLLTELDATTERALKTREELFTTIKRELTVHEVIEEEIFYPALKEHPRAKDIVLEAYEEHHVVDTLMGELSELPYDDETWGAKFKVMKENIEHHVEEEEGDMFKKARQVFDDVELDELGVVMTERKAEAMRDPSILGSAASPAGRS